ncbi:MAG TPA: excinuclease ABC subunit UvrC [Chitinophagales bacterium]|nr:excinuclease ABC subunit UvrC [Chitinophagales bacterium]
MENSLSEIVRNLPQLPGVYRYYDTERKLLYIGKAKSLKNRVSSYFVNKNHSNRIKQMVRKIAQIEYTVVATEKEALLLENNLIKELQPRYNIMLKDDKSYPYIKITNEAYPRVLFTRQLLEDGAEYFGPYTSVHHVRSITELIKKIYPTRTCTLPLTQKNIERHKFKVCLEYHIGNCLGPCENHQSYVSYHEHIDSIRKILKGKTSEIKQLLKQQMLEYAENLAFEKAEFIKIKMQSLKEYEARTTVANPNLGDMHVFGYTEENNKAFVNYFYVDGGAITKTKNSVLTRKLDENREEMLTFALQNMLPLDTGKTEILLPFYIYSENKEWNIQVPKIGEKRSLLDLAQKNAIYLKQKGKEKTKQDNTERILELMKTELKLKELPKHIECFDNSNFQGTDAVAACVVFKMTKPSKKDYRHFNIKTVQGPNDFDSMKEVVYRRYKRMMDEEQSLPQLVVIDGGKGQLSSAMESIELLGLENKIQLVSIAKRLEEIYYPHDEIPLHISKKSETLKVLQHIRNEAHRFGITHHRNKRDKNTLKTELTKITGIGSSISEKLLKKFGSVSKIKTLSEEELATEIGKAKAKLVFGFFNGIA